MKVLLGIVIGIVTVTLMGTAIEGLNNTFLNSISSIGADVLYVDRFGWLIQSREEWINAMKNPSVKLEEAEILERQLRMASAVAPVAQDNIPVKYHKRGASSVPVVGTTEQFQTTSGLTVKEGRFLSAAECAGGRPVCVIGADLATNLFEGASPVGETISANRRDVEVVGVLDKQGGFSDNGGTDNQIILPLTQFRSFIWSMPDYVIQVKARSLPELADAKEELRFVLRRYRHLAPGDSDNFAINQQEQILAMVHKITAIIGVIGLFITGLSLFVGGIGIMNIMFVSVAERTREIGLRKAIGAKRRTILLQFLVEAAAICLIGGAIGLGIAWPLTLVMQQYMPVALSPTVVGLALLVSLVTGVLSGFVPAWRAARMNPVDALRNE